MIILKWVCGFQTITWLFLRTYTGTQTLHPWRWQFYIPGHERMLLLLLLLACDQEGTRPSSFSKPTNQAGKRLSCLGGHIQQRWGRVKSQGSCRLSLALWVQKAQLWITRWPVQPRELPAITCIWKMQPSQGALSACRLALQLLATGHNAFWGKGGETYRVEIPARFPIHFAYEQLL